jgi:hypothetical protein
MAAILIKSFFVSLGGILTRKTKAKHSPLSTKNQIHSLLTTLMLLFLLTFFVSKISFLKQFSFSVSVFGVVLAN